MYKVIEVGDTSYKLEYSVEASLISECVTLTTDMLVSLMQNTSDVKEALQNVANIPKVAMETFYYGLIEHHGLHKYGDGRVPDLAKAKEIIVEYIHETGATWLDVMTMCIEQMSEDGFFKLTGMSQMLGMEEEKKEPKSPQDRRRKTAKA